MSDKDMLSASSGGDPYRRSQSFWERKSMEILSKLISPRSTPPTSPGPATQASSTPGVSSPSKEKRKSSGRSDKTPEINKSADKTPISTKNTTPPNASSPRSNRRDEDSVRNPGSRRNSDAKPSHAVVFSAATIPGPGAPLTPTSKSRSGNQTPPPRDPTTEGYRSDTPTRSRPKDKDKGDGYKSDGSSKKERRKSQTIISNGVINAADKPADMVDSPKPSSKSEWRSSRELSRSFELERRKSIDRGKDNAILVADEARKTSSRGTGRSSRHPSGDVSSSTIDSSRIIQLEDTLKSLLARVDSLQADLDKEKAEKEFLNKRLELTETALVSLVEDFRTQSAALGTLRADLEIMKMEHSSSHGHTNRSLDLSAAHAASMDDSDHLFLPPQSDANFSSPSLLKEHRKAKSTREFAAEIVGAAVGPPSSHSTPTLSRRSDHKKRSSKSSFSGILKKNRAKGLSGDEDSEESSKRKKRNSRKSKSTSLRAFTSPDVSDDSKRSDRSKQSDTGDNLSSQKSSRVLKDVPNLDLQALSDGFKSPAPGDVHSAEEDMDDDLMKNSILAPKPVLTPGSAFERRSNKTNEMLQSWLSPLEQETGAGKKKVTPVARRGSEGEYSIVRLSNRHRSGTAPNIFETSLISPMPGTPRVKSSSDDESEMSPKVKRDAAKRTHSSRPRIGFSKEAPATSKSPTLGRRTSKKEIGIALKRKLTVTQRPDGCEDDDAASNGGISPKSTDGSDLPSPNSEDSTKASSHTSSPFLFKLKGVSKSSFGVPLAQAPVDESRGVPSVLVTLVNALKAEKFVPEDLFDKKLDAVKVEALKKRVDAGASVTKEVDCYTVASTLKKYFLELPDCLLGSSKRKYWAEVADIDDATLAVSSIRSLYHSLDRPVRRTLEYVMDLFTRIVDVSRKLITPEKIGSVFGPIFLRSKKTKSTEDEIDSSDEKLLPDSSSTLVELFMQHYVEIFAFDASGIQFNPATHHVRASTIDNFVLLLLDSNYVEKEFSLIDHYREWNRNKKWQSRIRMRILMTLKTWIKQYGWSLHRDEDFRSLLQDFVEDVLEDTDSNKDLEVGILYSLTAPTLSKKEEDVHLSQRLLMHIALSPREITLDLSKCDAKVVANQISLMDSKLVGLIEPSELINGSSVDPHHSPHYTAMVNYINRITHWVAWDIVSKVTLNDRQRVLGFWIDVAKYCKGNGDFNGSWAVFGAFGLHAVARLTQTWEKLSRSEQSRHKRLTSLFDPRLNFGEYRKQLDRAQLNGPTVPILAFLPKDIIRFETDPTFTDERLVDFDKMRGIYSTLQGIAHCKNETLPFQRNEDIWECFLSLPLVPESRLEDYSYRAEPKLSSVMSSK